MRASSFGVSLQISLQILSFVGVFFGNEVAVSYTGLSWPSSHASSECKNPVVQYLALVCCVLFWFGFFLLPPFHRFRFTQADCTGVWSLHEVISVRGAVRGPAMRIIWQRIEHFESLHVFFLICFYLPNLAASKSETITLKWWCGRTNSKTTNTKESVQRSSSVSLDWKGPRSFTILTVC